MTLGSNFDGSGWYDDPLTAMTIVGASNDPTNDTRLGGNNINGGKAWTYGKEVWCNLEGRYMHIIADLSHLMTSHSSYKMNLCSLGIMGTEYVRTEAPLTEITIE